jgi:hypothetical protein
MHQIDTPKFPRILPHPKKQEIRPTRHRPSLAGLKRFWTPSAKRRYCTFANHLTGAKAGRNATTPLPPQSYPATTISEKSAIPEKSPRTFSSSANRFALTATSGLITITASKNASTCGRSSAIASSAAL